MRVPKRILALAFWGVGVLYSCALGDVAQLEERDNRTVEARGSSPLISTNPNLPLLIRA
jgi:hypothetical protein